VARCFNVFDVNMYYLIEMEKGEVIEKDV